LSETKIGDIIKNSLEGIREFADAESIIGKPIQTPGGVTVIPVSKISIGFATGGVDYGAKKLMGTQSFGGGGGTGLSITPMAFLTVNKNSEVSLIPITRDAESGVERAISVFERSPEIIQKIKDALT